jgi:hypothetical protein
VVDETVPVLVTGPTGGENMVADDLSVDLGFKHPTGRNPQLGTDNWFVQLERAPKSDRTLRRRFRAMPSRDDQLRVPILRIALDSIHLGSSR